MIGPALAAGALVGAGVVLVARGVFAPPPPRLSRRLAELYRPPVTDGLDHLRSRWQAGALRALASTGSDQARLQRDLEVCSIGLERHALAKSGFAVAGAAMPAGVAAVWARAGSAVPPGVVVALALVAAAGGFVLPDALLARQAARRRRDLRYALSSFLDLVVIVLAAGGGVETALHDAAEAGSGWAFDDIRRALDAARVRRISPWRALTEMGTRLGSKELVELAASVELAGTSGARVRESLRARAIAARDHELSESEAEALAASERMGAPMVAMFVGLILLIGYPAMATVIAL